MASLYGPANGNWKDGGYSVFGDDGVRSIRVACAREKLRRVMTTKCDGAGNLPGVTQEEQDWALKVWRDEPEWAKPMLREIGKEC